jgi:hypothetical protein
MFRGRAAQKLASQVAGQRWDRFDVCPHEELRQPDRVHVDPSGAVHVCQGISLGNLFRESLETLCACYEPSRHPIVGPLLEGGPAELARRYGVPVGDSYADACHLCDATRHALRSRFPEHLTPEALYGVMAG